MEIAGRVERKNSGLISFVDDDCTQAIHHLVRKHQIKGSFIKKTHALISSIVRSRQRVNAS